MVTTQTSASRYRVGNRVRSRVGQNTSAFSPSSYLRFGYVIRKRPAPLPSYRAAPRYNANANAFSGIRTNWIRNIRRLNRPALGEFWKNFRDSIFPSPIKFLPNFVSGFFLFSRENTSKNDNITFRVKYWIFSFLS